MSGNGAFPNLDGKCAGINAPALHFTLAGLSGFISQMAVANGWEALF
jgi:hypothetical protein